TAASGNLLRKVDRPVFTLIAPVICSVARQWPLATTWPAQAARAEGNDSAGCGGVRREGRGRPSRPRWLAAEAHQGREARERALTRECHRRGILACADPGQEARQQLLDELDDLADERTDRAEQCSAERVGHRGRRATGGRGGGGGRARAVEGLRDARQERVQLGGERLDESGDLPLAGAGDGRDHRLDPDEVRL